MTPEAIIHEAEEGGYWAEVPDLPGCFTQGQTLEELSANIREAVGGWIAAEPCGSLMKIVPLNDDEL
jgi:predicted RNase H-like HicB family nuclease